MELGSILQFLEDKTIFVTGATGYLAKIFVEKILRVQPKVKKFYLLLRAADAKSAAERLRDEVIGKELFRVLREKHGASLQSFISEKVTPVAGDISYEDLGVKDSSLKDEMWREVDVVLNFAATTDFDERYDVALGINTQGALHVLNFAKKCVNVKMLVHVSTAYVCGEDAGLIPEQPYHMGMAKKGDSKIDINFEKKMVQEKINELKLEGVPDKEITSAMKDLGIERARLFGWPNTYVFTKAMGEMLLMNRKDNLPLVIIRPTMVASTYKEPFLVGLKVTIDSIIAGYGKGRVTCFISGPQSTLDVVPADMVVSAIIVAMVARAKQHPEIIYHLGSSLRNPVNFSNLHDFSFRFSSVKIGKGIALTSMSKFYMYMALRFLLPLKALQLLNMLLFKTYQDLYTALDRKVKLVMRLVDLYKPYVFFEGIFDDINTEKLRIIFKESCHETNIFDFDPANIDWEDYMINVHIPGLVKYVMK
ncbi:acyl CoA reductase family protein [Salix suchowensis]|nr:acyl CoA reductase family protein [Salix suchowensis]